MHSILCTAKELLGKSISPATWIRSIASVVAALVRFRRLQRFVIHVAVRLLVGCSSSSRWAVSIAAWCGAVISE
jgi:hypothetical protein